MPARLPPFTTRRSETMLMTRYILRNLLTSTAFVAASLTTIIWLNLLLGRLSLLLSSAAPVSDLLKLVLMSTPQFVEVMLPLALVVGILFTYSRLASDNELAVMRSSGLSQKFLAAPALAAGAAVTVLALWFSTYLTPAGFYQMHALRQTLAQEYSVSLLREGVFNSFGDTLTIYIRSRKPSGEVQGLMIYDQQTDKSHPVTVTAKHGLIRMHGDMPTIMLYDGVREQASATGGIDRLHFAQYAFEINRPPEPQRPLPTIDESTLAQLLDSAGDPATTAAARDSLKAEVHRRILMPFNALGFSLVAVVTVLLTRPGRQGYHRSIIAAALVVSALDASDMSLANAIRTHSGLLPVFYLAVILPIAAGAFALHGKGEQLISDFLRWRRKRFGGAGYRTAPA